MKHFNKNIPSVIIGLAFVISGGGGGVAIAQEDSADLLEEVVVTGSRIPQKANLVSASPVTQVDADEFLYTGTTRVEDLLNDLPQTFSDNNSTDSNGAVGTASVDLRGLGRDRTLVLVNGKRLVRGSPRQAGGGADLNSIPSVLVKRVEVLTGGASAVYGSDAVAGVVNFILDDTFEGVRLDYQQSVYQHKNDNSKISDIVEATGFETPSSSVSDGDISAFSVALGGSFGEDRGYVSIYGQYREVDPILQANRDFSACALVEDNSECGGSSTLPIGRFTDFGSLDSGVATHVNAVIEGHLMAGNSTLDAEGAKEARKTLFTKDDEGELSPAAIAARTRAHDQIRVNSPALASIIDADASFDYVTADSSNDFRDRTGDLFNYAPANYYQRPDKTITLGGYGGYVINDYAEIYVEVGYTSNTTLSQIAPSGAFFVTEDLSCGNVLLSEQQFQEACGQFGLTREQSFSDLSNVDNFNGDALFYTGRRNVEGGFRQHDLEHITYRAVLGLRGDINDAWSYDISANHGQTDFSETYLNDLSTTRIIRSLDAVHDDDGNVVCKSVVDGTDPSCVPWNIFVNNGNQIVEEVVDGVTQGALNYINIPLYARGETKLKQYNAFVVGDLTDYGVVIPGADTGVGVSFGIERIEESLTFLPDSGYQSGDGAGQGGPTVPVAGELSVTEYFIEAKIPLVEGQPWADVLELDLGARSASYSTGEDTTSSKIAASWAINDNITLRASLQNAVRHAHVRELFSPRRIGLFDGTDPCTGEDPTPTEEECARSGVTSAQYGNVAESPAGQYNELIGGNPELKPEDSDTVSFGFIYTPVAVPGLSLTVDYYDIDLQGAIDGIGSQTILNECVEKGTPALCSLINRGSGGTLWITTDNIVNTNINTGFELRKGFDVNARYEFEMGEYGSMDVTFVATLLDTFDTQPLPGADVDDCVGKWGSICGAPNPELQANFRAVWDTPYDLIVSLALRYIDGVDEDKNDPDTIRPNFSSITYIDLVGFYTYKQVTFRLGANNVFDKEPPIAGEPPTGNGNTYPGVYDALGRYVFFGASLEF